MWTKSTASFEATEYARVESPDVEGCVLEELLRGVAGMSLGVDIERGDATFCELPRESESGNANVTNVRSSAV